MAGNKKENNILLTLVFIAVVVGAIFLTVKSNQKDQGIVCTEEAKLCPDGSYVGRSGPQCEFAQCPEGRGVDTSKWKTITDSSGVTFKYPENLSTTYIKTVDWPPKVQVIEGPFICSDAGEENGQAGITETKNINGREYCVTTVAEGAAGSTYTQYAYAREIGNKTLYFTFTLRAPQCANYDDPQKSTCEVERTTFNIDSIMDDIIQTANL